LWKEFMNDDGLEAMNISFLRGPVAQLTQSISQLSPASQKGAKKMGRWRFWRKGWKMSYCMIYFSSRVRFKI
jgi:hypothetical protein